MKSSMNLNRVAQSTPSFSDDVFKKSDNLDIKKHRKSDQYSLKLKRAFDLTLAFGAVIILFPMFLLLGLILVAFQGRPLFIKHKRVGQSGSPFNCFKFRTMVTNGDEVLKDHLAKNPQAREEWEATRKLKFDPRVTPIGHILRKSSVDELPQLLNVIRGDMSVVGPRPIVQDEVRYYGDDFAYYTKVRPGLTGLWQVSGRNDVSYRSRVQMDVRYAQEYSLSRDVVIIAKTIPAVLRSKGCY